MHRIVVEVQMRQEKMFVDVAAGQALLERVAIQEHLPVGDLLLNRCRQRWQPFEWRAQFEPAAQGGHLGFVQAGQTKGHSPEGILALESRVVVNARALLFPVERKIESLRQDGRVRQGVILLELQRPIHHARRQIRRRRLFTLVEHRREAFVAPLRGRLRISEQARQRRFVQAPAVVDQLLAGAPGNALPGRELELAGRVVTGVANHAALFKDRLHVATIRESGRRHGRHIEARRIRCAVVLVERVPGNCGAAAEHDDEQEQRLPVDDHEHFPELLRRAGECAPVADTGKA